MVYSRFKSLCYSNEFHIELVVLPQLDMPQQILLSPTLGKVIFLFILHVFLHIKVEEFLQWKYYSIHSMLSDNRKSKMYRMTAIGEEVRHAAEEYKYSIFQYFQQLLIRYIVLHSCILLTWLSMVRLRIRVKDQSIFQNILIKHISSIFILCLCSTVSFLLLDVGEGAY